MARKKGSGSTLEPPNEKLGRDLAGKMGDALARVDARARGEEPNAEPEQPETAHTKIEKLCSKVRESQDAIEDLLNEIKSEHDELIEELCLPDYKLLAEKLMCAPVEGEHAQRKWLIGILRDKAQAWVDICEAAGLDDDKATTEDALEALDEVSPVVEQLRDEREEMLNLLGLTEHEWATMGYSEKLKLRIAPPSIPRPTRRKVLALPLKLSSPK